MNTIGKVAKETKISLSIYQYTEIKPVNDVTFGGAYYG